MKDKTSRLNPGFEHRSEEYYKQLYGKDAVITRLGIITIVHLDHPSKEKIQKRTEEIVREELTGETFDDDCPLCQEMKNHPHEIVYYDQD